MKNLLKKLLYLLFLLTHILFSHQYELPEPESEVYFYEGYSLQFNSSRKIADWTAYRLTKEKTEGTARRTNNFRPDPVIKGGSAHPDDYKGSGYDRGHLVPAGDMKWSKKAMSESFLMSNIAPQKPSFNRQIWKYLEEHARMWAADNEEILIASGPVVTEGHETIGSSNVAVPAFFYKVIADYKEPEFKGIGFIIPNNKAEMQLHSYAVTIDEVEELTGINFFYMIPEEIQNRIESEKDLSLWRWRYTFEIQDIKK